MPDAHDCGDARDIGEILCIDGDFEYDDRWEWTLMAVLLLGVKMAWYRTDAYRHAIERRLPPDFYLDKAYYDGMLSGVTRAHIEAGIVTEHELKQNLEGRVPIPMVEPLRVGHSAPAESARFRFGGRVRVRSPMPDGHVRATAYVRRLVGATLQHGRHALAVPGQAGPRRNAALEFTYRSEFDHRALWRDRADNGTVTADLSDSDLEPEGGTGAADS